jgi:GT2 family glycosyltransferase
MSSRPARREHAPRTAVVIATHRRAVLLERLLKNLAALELPSSVVEILVVENGEPDETRSVCAKYSDALPLRYQHLREAGKSRALNAALDMTDAELVVQFDDDIRVEPATIPAFVRAARHFGPGHFFGGPVVPDYEGEPPPSWLEPWLTSCVIGWDLGEEERPHDEFLGANWAAFRSELLGVGGFLADFGPMGAQRTVGEEVEIQRRLSRSGCRGVYVPDARVGHFVRAEQCTLRWLRRRWYEHSLSRVVLSPDHLEAPAVAGAPRFLWRQWLADYVRLSAARVTSHGDNHHMTLERRFAFTRGQIEGYRRVRRGGGLTNRDRSRNPSRSASGPQSP